MTKKLIEYMGKIEDFRNGNAIRHKLIDIIVIAILAVICSADDYNEIQAFGEAKKEWLSKYLEIPNGIPSHDTFRRVISRIEPKQFHEAFMEWVKDIAEISKGEIIAIDGKTARRTKNADKKALHVVSAWAVENKIAIGQIKTEEKSNEITAIPELLEMLILEGSIVTIDAMGCQKEITKKIIEKEADYVISLKENQKNLYEDVELYCKTELIGKTGKELKELEKAGKYYRTIENDHGRIEHREYLVCNEIEWMHQKGEWEKLSGFGVCVSTVEKDGKKTTSYNYAIYSISNCTAAEFARCKRGHWGIENGLHWILDIAFREDESRARTDNAAENFNVLRHIALNLLRQEKTCKKGVKCKRLKCGWDMDYLLKVIGI